MGRPAVPPGSPSSTAVGMFGAQAGDDGLRLGAAGNRLDEAQEAAFLDQQFAGGGGSDGLWHGANIIQLLP
jgi:hypothetical protein